MDRQFSGILGLTTYLTDNANGNRLTEDTDDYTYDDADGLTDLEGVTWVTDENGNLVSRGADTFAWDHENRMVESVVSSVTSTYAYNGAGIRSSMTANSVTTD